MSGSAAPFDPYYSWLGIPPEEQPANHYCLLGVRLFEANPDAISNAAESRMMLVRQYQGGKYADASQELLNKLATARICLLNATAKAEYDSKLKAATGGSAILSAEAVAAPAPARSGVHAASPAGSKPLLKAKPLDAPPQRPAPQMAAPQAAEVANFPVVGGVGMPQVATHPSGLQSFGAVGAHPGAGHPSPLYPAAAPNQGLAPWVLPVSIGGGLLVFGFLLVAVVLPALFGGDDPEVVGPVKPRPTPNVPVITPRPPVDHGPGSIVVPMPTPPMPSPADPGPIVVPAPNDPPAVNGPPPMSPLRAEREFFNATLPQRDTSKPVLGSDDDDAVTTGMIGTGEWLGIANRLVVRYRLGKFLEDSSLVGHLGPAPAGGTSTRPRRYALAGRFELTRPATVRIAAVSRGMRSGRASVMLNGFHLFAITKADDTSVKVLSLRSGIHELGWDVVGADLGQQSLELTDASTGQRIPVAYTPNVLDFYRKRFPVDQMRGEWLLADRPVSVTAPGSSVVVVPPMPNPPMPNPPMVGVPAADPGDPDAQVLTGEEDDLNVTTGLLGRLLIDGNDPGVLIRWRPGREIKSSWFDDFRKTQNLASGTPTLELNGKFYLPKPQSGDSASIVAKLEGGARNGAWCKVTVDGREWMNTGGNRSTTDTSYQYIKSGHHDVKWEISGYPIGTCSLQVTTSGRTAEVLPITYTVGELRAARRFPLRTEVVLTTKNGLLMKWTGGKHVATSIQPLDPAEGPVIAAAPPPLVGEAVEGETKKLAPPTSLVLKQKSAEIAEVMKKEIEAAKKPEEKAALAAQLVKLSRGTKDDPAARYALLQLAWQAAAAAADAQEMEAAIEEIDWVYEVDVLKIREDAYRRAQSAAVPPDQLVDVTQGALDLIDLAVKEDRFDVGMSLLETAAALASRSRDRGLLKAAGDRRQEFASQKKQFDAVAPAQETLKTTPDDPAANAAIGKYYAAVKGDWIGALPHLEKGADADLADAAKLDAAGGNDADTRAKIGDAWWTAAEKLPEEERLAFKLRAHAWYAQAVPDLAGLSKKRIEARVAEMDEAAAKQVAAAAAAANKGGKEKPEPGLIYRVIDANNGVARPTPFIAVALASDEFRSWIDNKARDEARKLNVNSLDPYLLAHGIIYLPSAQPVVVEILGCGVIVDGRPVGSSDYVTRRIPLNLSKGAHAIQFAASQRYTTKFSVVDARGLSVLAHYPAQLRTELGVSVPFNGQPVKTMLLRNE